MDDLYRDLRFAGRMLLAKPAFTGIAVLSLALGIGANTTIFSLINELFLSALPIVEPERVMAIFTTDDRAGGQNPMSHLNWRDVREHNSTFQDVAAYDFVGVSVSTGEEPSIVAGLMVSGNYFQTLGVQPQRGRFFLPEEDAAPGAHPVAVLHHAFWTEELGRDPDIVGSTLNVNGHPFVVVGVAPASFNGLNIGFEPSLWIPMAMNPVIRNDPAQNWYETRRGLFLFAFGRLKPGVEPATAQADLDLLAGRLERDYADDNEGRGIALQPIADAALFNRGGAIAGTTLLMATVGLVLLIACANVANLLLARATERRREVAIRLAMGISRGRLVRQLLTESVMVSLLGGAAGLVVAFVSRDGLARLLANIPVGPGLALDLELDATVLAFTLVLSVLTGLLFGLLPALQSSRPELVAFLKDQGGGGRRPGSRLTARNALVVVQIALSIVALVGASLFVRSLIRVQQVDLGFDTERLIVLGFNVGLLGYTQDEGQAFYRQAPERVGAVPGVSDVALAQGGPLQATVLRSVFLDDRETSEERTFVQVNAVSPGFFDVMGVDIRRGRPFNEHDRQGSVPVVIVNEAMAEKYWPGEDPLGRRFHFFGMDPVKVVGVAEVIKYQNPGEDPQPYAYLPLAQHYVTQMNVIARTTGDPSPTLLAAQGELRKMEVDLVVNVNTTETLVANALVGQRMTAAFLGLFGGVAMALVAIGVYGVMSYAVRRRNREIGIRMALGAEANDVVGMVLREGAGLAAAGLTAGVLLALALTRLLRQFLLVSPTDPLAFGVTLALVTAVALTACMVPAWRAAAVDPVSVLRHD